MPIQWSGLGPELLLPLDRAPEPLRAQLERGLREAIRTRPAAGRASGCRPSASWPASLGVSRGLVVDCYDQLQAEGYLIARGRLGDPGRRHGRAIPAAPAPRPAGALAPRLQVDFRPGVPDLASFPRPTGPWALREACRDRRRTRRSTTATRAAPSVLRDGARRLPRPGPRRGRRPGPDRRVHRLRPGPQPGAGALAGARGASGSRSRTRVRRDRPASPRGRAGLEAVPVPVDEQRHRRRRARPRPGPARWCSRPAHQWPTGVCCRPARRQRAGRLGPPHAARSIIEDDYDAEFRYDREPVGAVQGLAPDRVVTIGTVSKSLAPALRLGWMRLPGRARRRRSPTRRSRPTAARPGWTSSRWPG